MKPQRKRVDRAGRRGAPEEGSVLRVVLADDHAVVRAGVRLILESAPGIRVVAEAGDGQQAIQAVAASKPDVAVLDVRMPGLSGIEVTRWIREHLPSTAVLMLSAYDDQPYVLAALQAGANGYVLKNGEADEIVRAVRSVRAGKSAVDSEVAARVLRSVLDAQQGAPPPQKLTEREREVMTMVAQGRTNKAIGAVLRISARTVQGHLASIFDKLQVESRTEAVMRAISLGLIPEALDREPPG